MKFSRLANSALKNTIQGRFVHENKTKSASACGSLPDDLSNFLKQKLCGMWLGKTHFVAR